MAQRPKRPTRKLETDITPPIFNPLSYKSLGAATAEALLSRDIMPLADLPAFRGEGIYAIYYRGDFEPYQVMSEANDRDRWVMPIYVGKADPKGARHGIREDDEDDAAIANAGVSAGYPMHDRLRQHEDSIRHAENLRIEDFWCRFILVNQVWVGLGEQMMIGYHAPIWNNPINGFGSKVPGVGRPGKEGRITGRSRWDTLHPGRPWAEALAPRGETAEMIANEVRQILAAKRRVREPDIFDEIERDVRGALKGDQ